jgi:hypothetical protein
LKNLLPYFRRVAFAAYRLAWRKNEYIFRGRSGQTKITAGEFYRPWRKAVINAELINNAGKHMYVFHTLRKSAVKYLRSKRIPDTIICRNFTGNHDFETFINHYDIESVHDEDLARRLLNEDRFNCQWAEMIL